MTREGHGNDRLSKIAGAMHNNDRPSKFARPDTAMSFPGDRLCHSPGYHTCHSPAPPCVSPQCLNMSFPGLTRESLSTTDCRVKPDNDMLSKIAVAMPNNDRLSKVAEAMHGNDRPGKFARPDTAMSFFACPNVLACHLPPVSNRHQKRVYYNTDFCTLR